MPEKKPPLHDVTIKKLAGVCDNVAKLYKQCGGHPVHVDESMKTRGVTCAEILRDGHVPAQHHPELARQLRQCGLQAAAYPELSTIIMELHTEFVKTPVCPQCGTGLKEDGSCENPMHSMDPSVRLVAESV